MVQKIWEFSKIRLNFWIDEKFWYLNGRVVVLIEFSSDVQNTVVEDGVALALVSWMSTSISFLSGGGSLSLEPKGKKYGLEKYTPFLKWGKGKEEDLNQKSQVG